MAVLKWLVFALLLMCLGPDNNKEKDSKLSILSTSTSSTPNDLNTCSLPYTGTLGDVKYFVINYSSLENV